jgi:hypothetical protein
MRIMNCSNSLRLGFEVSIPKDDAPVQDASEATAGCDGRGA